jgi:RNA polymerase sporulation-specific sigma factor
MYGDFSSIALNLLYLILGIGNPQSFPEPLSSSEEKALFLEMKKEKKGKARAKLIEHNLRLVAHIVRKYYTSYQSPDDLVSIGSLGLIKAIDTFDCENGARFATYASKCIQNEILMFFRSQKKLSNEVSINETIDVDRDGNPLTYIDIISSEDTIAHDLDIKVHVEKAYELIHEILDDRERKIIIMRYGLSEAPALTQREVAKALGISRSYVSRIEKKALERLKENFGASHLYFDSK